MEIEVAKLRRLVDLLPEGERRRSYQERLRYALEGIPWQTQCQADPQSAQHSEALVSQNLDVGYPRDSCDDSYIIWNGTASEYRSALVQKEAELELAKAQITGNAHADWWIKNRIATLQPQIADLKKWLAEAISRGDRT